MSSEGPMSEHKKTALFKYKSWSPDIQREDVWLKRRKNHLRRLAAYRRSLTLTTADDRRSSNLLNSADDHRSSSLLNAADERRSLNLLNAADDGRSLNLNAVDDRRSLNLNAVDDRRSLSLNAADERRRSMSVVTDDDVDELRACFELGFGFDTNSDLNPKLTEAFPALELYQAVNKLSRSSSLATSDCETPSSVESAVSIVEPGDDQETAKMRLKQWAQMVALSVLRSPPVNY